MALINNKIIKNDKNNNNKLLSYNMIKKINKNKIEKLVIIKIIGNSNIAKKEIQIKFNNNRNNNLNNNNNNNRY